MSFRSRIVIVSAIIALALASTLMPAVAEDVLTIDEAALTDDAATVSGTFNLDPITEAESVGGSSTRLADGVVGDAAGIDLVDARIQPLEDGSGLRFVWVVGDLPVQVPAEGITYRWAVAVEGNVYQLQATRTRLLSASAGEDPAGHADSFQLRGACTDDAGTDARVTPAGCYHLAFLEGEFDPAGSRVTVDWPFETEDAIGRPVAPDFTPGVALEPPERAEGSIAAAYRAPSRNPATTHSINDWNPYFVGPRVDLTAGPDSAAPESLVYGTPATVTADTFFGRVGGLSASRGFVWARACNGATCVYASNQLI